MTEIAENLRALTFYIHYVSQEDTVDDFIRIKQKMDRFAENAFGDIKIIKGSVIAGSVMAEISILGLEKNSKFNLSFVDKLG